MTNLERIQERAEALIPIKNDSYGNDLSYETRQEFIEAATFGLSLAENQWIKCSDRLPTKEEVVIIKCTTHRVCTTGYIHSRGYWIISNQHGSTYKENSMYVVTHWMPLPQPPKTEL